MVLVFITEEEKNITATNGASKEDTGGRVKKVRPASERVVGEDDFALTAVQCDGVEGLWNRERPNGRRNSQREGGKGTVGMSVGDLEHGISNYSRRGGVSLPDDEEATTTVRVAQVCNKSGGSIECDTGDTSASITNPIGLSELGRGAEEKGLPLQLVELRCQSTGLSNR